MVTDLYLNIIFKALPNIYNSLLIHLKPRFFKLFIHLTSGSSEAVVLNNKFDH